MALSNEQFDVLSQKIDATQKLLEAKIASASSGGGGDGCLVFGILLVFWLWYLCPRIHDIEKRLDKLDPHPAIAEEGGK